MLKAKSLQASFYGSYLYDEINAKVYIYCKEIPKRKRWIFRAHYAPCLTW